jgi:hypothetical protein
MWGVGLKETTAAELREDPIQRGGWVMGLFSKVNRLDFFVPKDRATGFAIVSSVDAIRAPKASSSATRPGQALGYFYLDAKLPSFSWRDRRCRALRRSTACLPGSIRIRATLAAGDLRGGIHPDPDRALVRDDR